MKNNKGFTLIELLAVIVILAIIALIATPIVLSLISKARQGAAEDSGYGLRKAAQLYYTESLLKATSFSEITFKCDGTSCKENPLPADPDKAIVLEIDGTVPENGTIKIKSTGEIETANIKIGGFDCTIPNTGNVTCGGESSNSGSTTTPEEPAVTTIPTIDSCPNCKFIYTTNIYAVEGSTLDGQYSSDIPEGMTDDYTTLGEHPYFLGIIESATTPGKIGRAFACGVENGVAFCLEGYDTSKYADSNAPTLDIVFPSCNASSSSAAHCTGISVSADAYNSGPYDIVDVRDDNGRCNVYTLGNVYCS